jgi:hypothetical protein
MEGLDKIILLRSEGARHKYHEKAEQPHCVRVYKSTPEDVTLQIRRKYEYISANLTLSQAVELRNALTTIVREFN